MVYEFKVLSEAPMSTGSRQPQLQKILSHRVRRSFNDAIHEEKKI